LTEGPGKSKSNPAGFSGEKIDELLKTLFPNEKEQLHSGYIASERNYSLSFKQREQNEQEKVKQAMASLLLMLAFHCAMAPLLRLSNRGRTEQLPFFSILLSFLH
jgi:hypothetical protein